MHRSSAPRPRLVRSLRRLAVLALALSVLPATADDPERNAPRLFFDRIEVQVLDLDVVVTDRQGERVTGLGRDDFRVTIDGAPVEVDYFREVRARQAVPGGRIAAGAAPAADAAAVEAVDAEAGRVNFLVFVDQATSMPVGAAHTLRVLESQLAQLRPGDRMTLVSWNGRELRRHGGWTADRERLVGQVAEVLGKRSRGGLQMTETAALDREVDLGDDLVEDPNLGGAVWSEEIMRASQGSIEQRIVRLSRAVEGAYDAAAATIAAHTGLPGRNVMILLSGLWPREIDVYVAGGPSPNLRSVASRHSPEPALERMVAAANLAGFTLYPIDTAGPEQAFGGAAEVDTGWTGTFAEQVAYQDRRVGREMEVEGNLLEIARATGGRAMTDQLRELALTEVAADVASYYSLGLTLERARDGAEHRVEVEVLRPGLEARARSGFTDLARDEEVAMAVAGALLFGEPLSRPLAVTVLGAPQPQGRRKVHLPVRLTIPLDEIVMMPSAGGFEARLELRVVAQDREGDRSEMPAIPVVFSGDRRPAGGEVAYYDTTLELRDTGQRLVLALHDTVSESFLSAVLDLQPPGRGSGE